MAWVLLALACGGPPPPVAPPPVAEPSSPAESLGGATYGTRLDPSGFDCQPNVCKKPAEIAGASGTLSVYLCGGLVHQISFREEFAIPDSVADQLHLPDLTSAQLWAARMIDALKAVGFEEQPIEADVLKALETVVGPPMKSATGRQLEAPAFRQFVHSDGRMRMLELVELPGAPEQVAIHPDASNIEITLTTSQPNACTSGM